VNEDKPLQFVKEVVVAFTVELSDPDGASTSTPFSIVV